MIATTGRMSGRKKKRSKEKKVIASPVGGRETVKGTKGRERYEWPEEECFVFNQDQLPTD
jgi:hypothetical protein